MTSDFSELSSLFVFRYSAGFSFKNRKESLESYFLTYR
ncbi:hypothetical protein NC99_28240 [Sunxiuqinia dokdonensis]|uniref:Uncharacterized protein n=1 Tax=Sunxiuqinia dokdonensis TaxID=1409788 RepID=A0A0L8V852_9BACT|nr:hypothetical protein NC99_28240 [Sunxiuqinia dokdonensis]